LKQHVLWLTLVQAYVSLHCITALAILIVIIWLNTTRNTTHGKFNAYGYVRTEVKTLNALLNLVLMESIILFPSPEFWGSFCVKLICIYALKIICNCQLHPTLQLWNVSLARHHFNSASFPEYIKHTNFCTRCFLYNCLKHLLMPKSKGCNMLMQCFG
jgi:hypothetical protein